jgi:hypothetical protein
MTKRADLGDTTDLLHDARNLVDALRLVHLGEGDAPLLRLDEPESIRKDRHRHIIESLAATAVEKLEEALTGAFLDPPGKKQKEASP